MTSGEFDYGDIFFKDLPPVNFSCGWDQGHEHVPFPALTYTLFVVFFFLASIVALNVLVGLTVELIPGFFKKADLLLLKSVLQFVLEKDEGIFLMNLYRQFLCKFYRIVG